VEPWKGHSLVTELGAFPGYHTPGSVAQDEGIGLFCWGETRADLVAALEQAYFEAAWRGWRLPADIVEATGGIATRADRGAFAGRPLALRKVDYGRVIEFYDP
jgi:hypothetical protein